ncbi:phytanoyl-CoA dioxygenase family protein [Pararhizobium sp. A13]|uniref:phytanoyl-CoA dioxygenase family protein n=1 Tax=Pararhizobium sp. A13 TaxID=3133975 RepID=UPI00311B16BF
MKTDLSDFRAQVEVATRAEDYPLAVDILSKVPIYEGRKVGEGHGREWARVLGEGPGVYVIRNAFTNLDALDEASGVFQSIIAEEREGGNAAGDHFAMAGANDRVWNSLQKLCLRAPRVYSRYIGNPVIEIACRSWLGPGYQMATQVNQVRPGGKAQAAHRDYHLGFMTAPQMEQFPEHVHAFGPRLVLQGGVAHCDMPVESGTTKLLPHSQRYLPGYIAATEQIFRDYFEENFIQLPLGRGDVIFFSPALFHAAGANRTTNVVRLVNLLQVASPFAKHMESLDRTAMCMAVYPHLAELPHAEMKAVIAATADSYPFPTNLDNDPPIGGLAPPSQQDIVMRAVEEGWSLGRLSEALTHHEERRAARQLRADAVPAFFGT